MSAASKACQQLVKLLWHRFQGTSASDPSYIWSHTQSYMLTCANICWRTNADAYYFRVNRRVLRTLKVTRKVRRMALRTLSYMASDSLWSRHIPHSIFQGQDLKKLCFGKKYRFCVWPIQVMPRQIASIVAENNTICSCSKVRISCPYFAPSYSFSSNICFTYFVCK